MSSALQNRVAVVTGAARGIGLAIAERLAADGAKLILGDADADALKDAADALGDVTHESGDLAQEEVAGRLISRAVEEHGRLDILVNNAGGGIIKPFLEQTPDTLRTTVDRNLWTAMWCCWHALPVMRRQGFGRIINIGADSVRNGLWDHAAYNAAKGGMHGLTTGLAREFAGDARFRAAPLFCSSLLFSVPPWWCSALLFSILFLVFCFLLFCQLYSVFRLLSSTLVRSVLTWSVIFAF